MTVKKVINDSLSTPMSRKDFLAQVGTLFLAIIGVHTILNSLGGHKSITTDNRHETLNGYGSSPYGR